MITVELFSGTKSFSKVAKALGHKTFTVDIDENLDPDLVCDILDFDIGLIPFDRVDVLWMSPPCTTFSVASIRHYWVDGKPKNDKCLHGISMVQKALEVKDRLLEKNPNMLWYLENPRGMLRKQDFMQNIFRRTITYCQYGDDKMKPTDIWTNDIKWIPRRMCKNNSPCHNSAKRGSDTGTQGRGGGGKYGWLKRTTVPGDLFKEIFRSIPVKEFQAILGGVF